MRALGLLLVLALAGCVTDSPPPVTSSMPLSLVGQEWTPAVHPSHGTLQVGESMEVSVAVPVISDLAATGSAVLVVAQIGITGSDRQTWEVRAQEPGTTTLSAEGSDGVIRIDVTVE